ncbi:MAG: HAD family phosphatase [Prevotella sp.]|nr:HAD family phosphatase [Prevotella sp.]
MIKNIVFDFGGVVVTLDHQQAVRKFKALGLKDAESQLDPYTQGGIFGELEMGRIGAQQFVEQLSTLCGKQLSYKDCSEAWLAYRKEVPRRNLKALQQLREQGFKLILLSNTNPFMMEWAESEDFDGDGHPVGYYFDNVYASYREGVMKPDLAFFKNVLRKEGLLPGETLFVDDGPRNVAAARQLGIATYCPVNGKDWTKEIYKYIDANSYGLAEG